MVLEPNDGSDSSNFFDGLPERLQIRIREKFLEEDFFPSEVKFANLVKLAQRLHINTATTERIEKEPSAVKVEKKEQQSNTSSKNKLESKKKRRHQKNRKGYKVRSDETEEKESTTPKSIESTKANSTSKTAGEKKSPGVGVKGKKK